MRDYIRSLVALLLCELLILLPASGARMKQPVASARSAEECASLSCYVRLSYLKLFELAPKLEFTPTEIQQERDALNRGEDFCVGQFKSRSRQFDSQLDAAQKELRQKSAKINDGQRHVMHCNIQNLRLRKSQDNMLASHAIPTAYDNMQAKLDIIEKWPAEHRQILAEIANGSYLKRRWGDVKDIGFRVIEPGQEKDIRTGQDAIQQMKENGLLPPALHNKSIQEYVNSVAQRVARHSDLHIPLHVTVLNSKEINAFALPGGYLFVERGLLEAADDESELAGVMGHEIGHVTARHAHQLMTKATIADIFYQAAEVAAMIFTGGVASIGMYYALQYGFYGLGLVLDLKLLGVSREYELQADQLGIQYTWNAGYDPTGFIRFFDKMATEEGYVSGVSWFRTHPPFYQRMVDAEREIEFLPKKPQLVMQTAAFEKMKKELAGVTAAANKKSLEKPSLMAREPGCPPPQKIEYRPGELIEKLCGAPAVAH